MTSNTPRLALAALLAAASIATAAASNLSPTEAWSRVKSQTSSPTRLRAMGQAPTVVASIYPDGETAPAIYVFSTGNDGFAVVGADDAAAPLIGYSDTGKFTPGSVPPALQAMLDFYASQIGQASALGVTYSAGSETARQAISPMLTTLWNQDAPYNDLTPRISGQATYTGCVATAMAQMMKYHNYPAKGTGTASYTWNNTTLTMDLSTTEFDWNNMINAYTGDYTSVQGTAVATLMKACGYSVQMDYGTSESGASSYEPPVALTKYFGYSPSLANRLRQVYTTSQWNDLIYASLADDCPVVYCGTNNASGHCFVIDGYSQDDYFHVNWGWAGLSNGYFLLSVLSPGSQGIGGSAAGYNQNQSAVVGARPAQAGDVATINICETDVLTASAAGTTVTMQGFFGNYGVETANITPGVRITADADGAAAVASQFESSSYSLPTMQGFSTWSTADLTALPAGTYRLYPVYRTADGAVETVPVVNTLAGYTLATKSASGTVTATVPRAGDLSISDLVAKTPYYIGKSFLLEGTLTSTFSEAATVDVMAILINSQGQVTASAGISPTDVVPGAQSFTYTGTIGSSVAAGNYQLVLAEVVGTNSEGSYSLAAISDYKNITVGTAPTLEVTLNDWSISNGEAYVDPNNITVSASLSVTQGLLANDLIMFIFPLSGGNSVGYIKSSEVFLATGETQTTNFSGAFAGTPGTTYMANLYYIDDTSNYQQLSQQPKTFTITKETGIEDVSSDSQATAPGYDLQGRPASEFTKGIIISAGNKFLRR